MMLTNEFVTTRYKFTNINPHHASESWSLNRDFKGRMDRNKLSLDRIYSFRSRMAMMTMAKPKKQTREERLRKKRLAEKKRYDNIKNNAELWAEKQEKNRKSYIQKEMENKLYLKKKQEKRTVALLEQNTPPQSPNILSDAELVGIQNPIQESPLHDQSINRELESPVPGPSRITRSNSEQSCRLFPNLEVNSFCRKSPVCSSRVSSAVRRIRYNKDKEINHLKQIILKMKRQNEPKIKEISPVLTDRNRRNSRMTQKVKQTQIHSLKTIPEVLRKEIEVFFEDDENSRLCSGKKECITRNKVRKQKRYISDTLVNLHEKFLKTSSYSISYSAFCKMRPFWWETKEHTIQGTARKIRTTEKLKKREEPKKCIEKLESTLDQYLIHCGNIVAQQKAFKHLKEHLQEGECIIHIDYSENYAVKCNNEIQSYHFGGSRKQLTLHTSVIYYLDDEKIQQVQSFCTVSECLRHDISAVWAHIVPILEYIGCMKMHQIVWNLESPVIAVRKLSCVDPECLYKTICCNHMNHLGFYSFEEVPHNLPITPLANSTRQLREIGESFWTMSNKTNEHQDISGTPNKTANKEESNLSETDKIRNCSHSKSKLGIHNTQSAIGKESTVMKKNETKGEGIDRADRFIESTGDAFDNISEITFSRDGNQHFSIDLENVNPYLLDSDDEDLNIF
ncbi:hypothetical protein HW555_013504 [Spodoptera exigua]|uniref:Uncharacterized protein n=1 Tax=Spodoptera exigua TaxID=7107 RepID=A0A835G503_SPOEX|nr:hypothetical protein HW555_013504 [Spodoptera exigua]